MKKIAFGFFATVVMASLSASTVEAHDPFAFQFGYSLGFQNSFRNRLPTPPYFSVYPPVYYGQRYYRPYGESPYASWPLLQPNPTYRPEPARGVSSVVIQNHHVIKDLPKIQIGDEAAPVAQAPDLQAIPEAVVVINPFALEHYAKLETAK